MTAAPVARWEGESPAHWRAAWRLPVLEIYDTIASTNDRARVLASGGAAAGTLVMAEQQAAGRGRLGRAWVAPHASSLLMSFVLRPAGSCDGTPGSTSGAGTTVTPGTAPGTAPLRLGMAVADAIQQATGVSCSIKWPNDLVVPGRGKIAGLLCEATSAGEENVVIVAGVGVNVRQRADDWPPELRGTATSVEACAGRAIDRAALAAAIVDALRPMFGAALLPLSEAELAAYGRRDALRDRSVTVDGASPVVARGIDSDGALLVQDGDDGTRRITTATLRLVDNSGRTAMGAAT